MTDHFHRGCLLYDSRRFKEAEEEFRLDICAQPQSASARSMLALTLLTQDRLDEARKMAEEAISLDPDNSFAHYARSFVLYNQLRLDDALKSIEEALRLDPYDADYYGHASAINLARDNWKAALELADNGLEMAADHVECLNCRAFALTRLGKLDEAEEAVTVALARDPENDLSHANRASIFFRRGKPAEAAEHFREALRLNPHSKWARDGILEALRARNPVYYPFARLSLLLSDLDRRVTIVLILLLVFVPPARMVLLSLAVFSFLSRNFFNLILFTDPFGKRILNEDEKGTSIIFACWLFVLIADIATFSLVPSLKPALSLTIIYLILLALPLLRIYSFDRGGKRYLMIGWTALAGLMGLAAVAFAVYQGETADTLTEDMKAIMGIYVLACLLSVFIPSGKQS